MSGGAIGTQMVGLMMDIGSTAKCTGKACSIILMAINTMVNLLIILKTDLDACNTPMARNMRYHYRVFIFFFISNLMLFAAGN